MKTQYKLEAGTYDVYDYWKADNLALTKEILGDKILSVKNSNSSYINIFHIDYGTYIREGDIFTDEDYEYFNSIEFAMEQDYIDEYIEYSSIDLKYTDHTDEEKEKIEEIFSNRLDEIKRIEISCSGYSQSEWDNYTFYIKSDTTDEDIEVLDFIKELFTICETRIELYSRKVTEIEGEEFRTDWEFEDAISTTEELPDIEKLSKELLDNNDIDHNEVTIPEQYTY